MSLGMRILSLLFFIALPIQAMEFAEPARDVREGAFFVDENGFLDISGRGLESLPRIWDIPRHDAIKTINASNNELSNVSLDAGWFPATVTSIDLSHNKLTEFPSAFISKLPKTVKYINLSNNQIANAGEDVNIAQRGLKIDLSANRLSADDYKIISARIARTNALFNLGQRFVQYITSPSGRLIKIVGGVAMVACYGLLKESCGIDSRSIFSRLIKSVQNGLYLVGGVHTIYDAYMAKQKLIEENPELALGTLGLFIGTTPGIINDTVSLASGSDTGLGKMGSIYANTVNEGMRTFGTVYAAGQCVSWLKGKFARTCNAYLDRQRNGIVAH